MSDMLKVGAKDLTFTFSVSRGFIGPQQGETIEIHTGFGFGDCGFPFEKGEEYLVYAHKYEGKLSTGICSRTRHLTNAGDDIGELGGLHHSTRGATVSGRITRYEQSSLIGDPFLPLVKHRIRLNRIGSRKVYRSVTDGEGQFRFSDLPAGSYRLDAGVEKGWELDDYETEAFRVNARGCAVKNLTVESDNEGKVTVVDPDGQPVKSIWVEFVPVGVPLLRNRFPREFSVTNPQGVLYWFNRPPGEYTVSVNYHNPPDAEAPFPPTFAPGVLDRNLAEIIRIRPGSVLKNLVIKIPRRLEERMISGTVFWPDGSPANDASVFLIDSVDEDAYVDESVETDEQGQFRKVGYAGRSYKLHVRGEKDVGEGAVVYRAETSVFAADGDISAFRIVLQPTSE